MCTLFTVPIQWTQINKLRYCINIIQAQKCTNVVAFEFVQRLKCWDLCADAGLLLPLNIRKKGHDHIAGYTPHAVNGIVLFIYLFLPNIPQIIKNQTSYGAFLTHQFVNEPGCILCCNHSVATEYHRWAPIFGQTVSQSCVSPIFYACLFKIYFELYICGIHNIGIKISVFN